MQNPLISGCNDAIADNSAQWRPLEGPSPGSWRPRKGAFSRCAPMARVHKTDTRPDTESDAETSPLLGRSRKLPSGKMIHSGADTSEVAFRAKLGAAVLSKIMRRHPGHLRYRRQGAQGCLRETSGAPQVPAGCPHKCCGMGARKWGYRLNRASASKGPLAFNGNITCCSGVSTTVEALRQAQFH